MRFVVDCSVALKWVVAEHDSESAALILHHELYGPDFLYVECANALWKLVQRGEASAGQAAFKLRALRQVRITVAHSPDTLVRALELACSLPHPVYDCLYLAIAETLACPVVTADARLLRQVAGTGYAHLAIGLQEAAAN